LARAAVSALATAFLALALIGCGSKAPTPQADLDRKFQQMMNNVTLVGRSSRLNGDQISGPERYVIEKVTRLTGDMWLFQTRMQFGKHDLPLPVPVAIKWAGDTPVITLTDLKLPGMNPYTARVVLYGDQYAGTWSGKGNNGTTYGGQLFGKIVRNGQ
jgi:hypothetical protein